MTPRPPEAASEALLRRLQAHPRGSLWVTPAESLADAWVLVVPLRAEMRIAVRKFKEDAITELVRQGMARWTPQDENVPPYLCGALTREPWFMGRKGRRIELTAGGAPNHDGRLHS